jgi:hypothetical protein
MLYFIARYRLHFTDDEFWNCTPRKFWKLFELMNGKEPETSRLPTLADLGI